MIIDHKKIFEELYTDFSKDSIDILHICINDTLKYEDFYKKRLHRFCLDFFYRINDEIIKQIKEMK